MSQLARTTNAPNPKDVYIGNRLRDLRSARKTSQTELGKASGISFQQIQKYECGMNRISVSRLIEFSEFFGIAVSYFFVGLDKHAVTGAPSNAQELDLLKYFRTAQPDAQISILSIAKQAAQISA